MKNFICLFLLFFSSLCFAKITVELEPNNIKPGETFRLILSLDNPKTQSMPDLTPLQQNFNILGTERSISYSIINGQTSSINQWIILLMPKKTGILTIPAIRIGQEFSPATSINISTNNTSKSEPMDFLNKDVILKIEVTPKEAYINQQILYTVKLYNSQRIMDAEYQPPQVEDALIMPVGESKRSEALIEGRTYLLEEQKYAIFPQKVGNLIINPPSFSAIIFNGVPHRVSVSDKQTKIQVKPTPSHTAKYWLPAKQLAITETYDSDSDALEEGTTLVRKITLQASGLPAELLPPLEFKNHNDYNSYPEKTELNNSINENGVLGKAEVKITYVLNHSGKISLPPLELKWFNTETNKEEVAKLPEKIINVISKVKKSEPAIVASEPKPPTISNTVKNQMESPSNTDKIAWGVAIFFALAWIATLFLLKKPKTKPKIIKKNLENKNNIKKTIKNACFQNDATMTEKALIMWAQKNWPQQNILNLNQIASLVNYNPLKQELLKLSAALYQPNNNKTWQGAELWKSLQDFLHQKPPKNYDKETLPPINP